MIRPLGNRIIVRPMDDDTLDRQLVGMAKGGVTATALMSVAEKAAAARAKRDGVQLVTLRPPVQGTVMAIGRPFCTDCHRPASVDLEVGDVVVYPKTAGLDCSADGEPFVVMNLDDVLVIWRPEGVSA